MEDLSIFQGSNLLYTQEAMWKYRPGGFHPVCLGDSFKDGRYKVHHKLGWGGFSTVWLARDTIYDKWVSIKITIADKSAHARELDTLQSLEKKSPHNLSHYHIVQLLDHFSHKGPNGTHHCLVFELLGPTVGTVAGDIYAGGDDALDAQTILRMSKQILQALKFLHEVGYAHGDLSSRNVAFTSNGLSKLTQKDLFEVIGHPETKELVRKDGKPLGTGLPRQLVKATGWDSWTDEDEEDLRIFDLGEAFPKGKEPKYLSQPSNLKAPETIFEDRCDSRLDLWRAGILIYTFLFGACPFSPLGDDGLVSTIIHFVEELPAEWRPKWNKICLESGETFPHLRRKPAKSILEQKFDEKVHDQSLKRLLPVIKGLLRFRPSDRISAARALEMVIAIDYVNEELHEDQDEVVEEE